MFLIGTQEYDGKLFFLLQSWWTKKQLVEVDEHHLRACGARLSFVVTLHERFPEPLQHAQPHRPLV